MSTSPRPPESRRRPGRWLLSLAAIALLPKCGACVLATLGLASLLGLGGPEWCGAPDDGRPTAWLWIGGLVLSAALWTILRQRRRDHPR